MSFKTTFAAQDNAEETVTFIREKDGTWKAAGYFIHSSEMEVAATAEAWLAGIDAGNYAQSWKTAAALFRQSITETGWSDALTKARKPLGIMKSRKLLSAKIAKKLPGAPDGDYVVMQFETSFAAKEKAVETVTFTKEEDGTWKASGYFIR